MAVRRDAYLEAIGTNGQPADPSLIWTAQTEMVTPTTEVTADAIDNLVDKQHVDAIVAPNDVWAARLIQGLKARGHRVPEDVAVTGYDNLDLATAIDPPLTTIDQQHDRYAAAALDMLIAIASGVPQLPPEARTVVVPPKLVVRGSA